MRLKSYLYPPLWNQEDGFWCSHDHVSSGRRNSVGFSSRACCDVDRCSPAFAPTTLEYGERSRVRSSDCTLCTSVAHLRSCTMNAPSTLVTYAALARRVALCLRHDSCPGLEQIVVIRVALRKRSRRWRQMVPQLHV